MADDLDIYRAAKPMIDQHGDDAALYSSGRADLLLNEGDMAGATVWRMITAAVEEPQRQRRPDEAIK